MKPSSAALTLKDAVTNLKVFAAIAESSLSPTGNRTLATNIAQLEQAIETSESAPPAAERTAQRDAALEIRTRIIDILDECDRTVYAQQKWKVAHAGLQGWLFKVEVENLEIIREVADASEGMKSE